MALPKWTDERTDTLTEFVGEESPVSQSTVIEAADELETSPRSVASKLRKMGYEVESAVAATTRTFSENQEATLQTFVTDNAGQYTYGEIAEAFEGGAFSPKQIQGKLLSMQLTEHVRPTPKQEKCKKLSQMLRKPLLSRWQEATLILKTSLKHWASKSTRSEERHCLFSEAVQLTLSLHSGTLKDHLVLIL